MNALHRSSLIMLFINFVIFLATSQLSLAPVTSAQAIPTALSDFITGPHYIKPLPVEEVVQTGYPAAIKGTCEAGTVFTISTVDDLLSNVDNLECIYNAGLVPNTVPLGPQYGTVLKFGTSDALAPLLAPLWQGKVISHLRCPNELDLGLNVIQGRFRVAALIYIGVPNIKLAPGEYTDGKDTLIIDYTQTFGDKCTTPPGSIFGQEDLSLNILDNIYPFRMIVDVVRLVGRQSDNGAIYLGKTYVQDPFRSDRQAYNIAFWSIVNYDPLVVTLDPLESLPPLTETFTFMEPGAFQGFRLLVPFDNFLVDASTTLQRFFNYFDAIASLINNRLKIDISRGATRARTAHLMTLVSGAQFLTFEIASALAQSPLLIGLSAESVAEGVIFDESFPEEQKTMAHSSTKESKKGLREDGHRHEQFMVPFLRSMRGLLRYGSKAPEILASYVSNEYTDWSVKRIAESSDKLSATLQYADDLKRLLNEIVATMFKENKNSKSLE